MLGADDIDLRGSKGRLCIYTDSDKPCARMLVLVHRAGEDAGTYFIEYVRSDRMIQGIVGPVHGDDLTPLEHFGFHGQYDEGHCILMCRPHGHHGCKATYRRNGQPREWQGNLMVVVHPEVIGQLKVLFG